MCLVIFRVWFLMYKSVFPPLVSALTACLIKLDKGSAKKLIPCQVTCVGRAEKIKVKASDEKLRMLSQHNDHFWYFLS